MYGRPVRSSVTAGVLIGSPAETRPSSPQPFDASEWAPLAAHGAAAIGYYGSGASSASVNGGGTRADEQAEARRRYVSKLGIAPNEA